VLVGLAIERVTGRPYRHYVVDEVFTRAGMLDSGLYDRRDAVQRVAEGEEFFLPQVKHDEATMYGLGLEFDLHDDGTVRSHHREDMNAGLTGERSSRTGRDADVACSGVVDPHCPSVISDVHAELLHPPGQHNSVVERRNIDIDATEAGRAVAQSSVTTVPSAHGHVVVRAARAQAISGCSIVSSASAPSESDCIAVSTPPTL